MSSSDESSKHLWIGRTFIGRRTVEIGIETKEVPDPVESKETRIKIKSEWMDKSVTPDKISANVLKKLANEFTVTAYFKCSQRQVTKNTQTRLLV